jgi:hypothetical protein
VWTTSLGTYSLVVDPEWHPRYNDNHEARNVDGEDEEGQLPGKSQLHPKTAVSTWKTTKNVKQSKQITKYLFSSISGLEK